MEEGTGYKRNEMAAHIIGPSHRERRSWLRLQLADIRRLAAQVPLALLTPPTYLLPFDQVAAVREAVLKTYPAMAEHLRLVQKQSDLMDALGLGRSWPGPRHLELYKARVRKQAGTKVQRDVLRASVPKLWHYWGTPIAAMVDYETFNGRAVTTMDRGGAQQYWPPMGHVAGPSQITFYGADYSPDYNPNDMKLVAALGKAARKPKKKR